MNYCLGYKNSILHYVNVSIGKIMVGLLLSFGHSCLMQVVINVCIMIDCLHHTFWVRPFSGSCMNTDCFVHSSLIHQCFVTWNLLVKVIQFCTAQSWFNWETPLAKNYFIYRFESATSGWILKNHIYAFTSLDLSPFAITLINMVIQYQC